MGILANAWSLSFLFAAVCGAALAASLIIELIYRPRLALIAYSIMRALAILVTAMLIARMESAEWDVKDGMRKVALLRDVSGSMERLPPETRGRLDRMESDAMGVLSASKGFIIEEYSFAGDFKAKGDGSCKAASSTALGDALLKLNWIAPGASVMLSSDALSNSGLPPQSAAQIIAPYGTRIYPLLPMSGGRSGAFNLRISRPEGPASWNFTDGNQFRCLMELSGDAPASITPEATLLVDGVEASARKPSVISSLSPIEMHLPSSFKVEPGWHEFSISVKPLDGEASDSDNTVCGLFKVPDADGVLMLWDRAGPELSALRPILSKLYKGLDFAYASDFAAESAPEQSERIGRCSLIVMGNVSPGALKSKARGLLASRLKDGSACLAMLNPACFHEWLEASEIAPMLPFAGISKSPSQARAWMDFSSGGRSVSLPTGMHWHLEPSGGSSAKFMIMEPELSRKSFPALLSSGRVMAVSFVGSWRWRLDRDRGRAAAFDIFWERALSSLAKSSDGSGLVLSQETNQSSLAKDAFNFELEDFKAGGKPRPARLVIEDRARGASSTKGFTPLSAHSYTCEMRGLPVGVNWLHAELDGRKSNRMPVVVEDEGLESKGVGISAGMLELIAKASGGAVLDAKAAASLDAILERSPQRIYSRRADEGGSAHEAMLALAAFLLLAAEWLARKLERRSA